jgi:hypothetical protein
MDEFQKQKARLLALRRERQDPRNAQRARGAQKFQAMRLAREHLQRRAHIALQKYALAVG